MLIPATSHRFTGEGVDLLKTMGLRPLNSAVRCCLKSSLFMSAITEIPKGLVATKHLQYECKKM